MDNLQSLPIDDFSGGMTDFIVGANPSQNEVIKNMVIDENRDLVTRPGSRPKFTGKAAVAPREIFQFASKFLVQAEENLYSIDNSGVTAVNVTGGSDAFIDGSASTRIYKSSWNENAIITSNDLIRPLRLWENESNNFELETLGLPYIMLGYLITLANELKTDFNAHIADTGEHSSAGSNTVTSANATDFDTLMTLAQELLTKYELHLDNTSIHPGAIDSADRLEDRVFETIYGCAATLADMKAKFNAHDNDGTAHTSGGGSHQITSPAATGDIASSAGGTGNTYLYALHYKYNYQTPTKLFLERSDILYIEIADVGAPETNNITITLPGLSSLVGYDMTNVEISIYRTFNDSATAFYKLDDVAANTASYVDAKSDTSIENNQPLYADGGELSDEPPPKAKFSVVVNDTLVLGDIQAGTEELTNVLQISKPAKLYSCPSSFRLEFEGDIKGLGYINTYPIVFLEDKVYRVEGSFDSFGKGFLRKRQITDTVGAINHKSIVSTKKGVFFAGADGFYATDGFEAKRISSDINDTYNNLADKSDIEGTYDRFNNRVMWSAKMDSSNTYNDSIFVADLDYSTPKGGFPFSIWDGGEDPANFSISGIGFDNDEINLLRLDPRGYLIYHDTSLADDCFVNINKTPDTWDTQTIFYRIDSVALDFGNPKVRKWVPKININAQNVSTIGLQIDSANDNSGQFSSLKEIVDQSNLAWGDPSVVWGDDDILWNLIPIISAWRYFPAVNQKIRCMYKQLRFKNAYTEVDNSNSLGNASVTASSTTVTLLNHPSTTWGSDNVNYFIRFAHENYAFDYKITAISGADLTISDSANTLTDSSSTAFKIFGYKKGEVLNLSNYVVSYNPITMTQNAPQGSTP